MISFAELKSMSNREINFFYENVSYTLNSVDRIENWIYGICSNEKKVCGIINIIFCGDNYLLELNKKYLNHDYFTDILTFAANDEKMKIEGDIYISIDMAFVNAKKYKVQKDREIERLVAHGVLHLCGFSDHSKDDQILMTTKEDYYLSLLDNL